MEIADDTPRAGGHSGTVRTARASRSSSHRPLWRCFKPPRPSRHGSTGGQAAPRALARGHVRGLMQCSQAPGEQGCVRCSRPICAVCTHRRPIHCLKQPIRTPPSSHTHYSKRGPQTKARQPDWLHEQVPQPAAPRAAYFLAAAALRCARCTALRRATAATWYMAGRGGGQIVDRV
jgi:hypothetical protein